MDAPLDLSAARRLTEAELAAASPTLARIASHGFVDAFDGPGGTFVVYTSGSMLYVLTLTGDGPTMVEVADLHGWNSDFAVPVACALAAGAIATTPGPGCLEIDEFDSDRAYDSYKPPPPEGLVQRRLLGITWGVTTETLDPALRITGYWNEAKTELMLILGSELSPFKRMDYRFTNGTLSSVEIAAWSEGDWSVMEQFEVAMRRHLPNAKAYELESGAPWTATTSRSRLEGVRGVELKLRFDLAGANLTGAAVSYQKDGKQNYRLYITAFPPS
jgi:hypothetical protein